MQVCNYILHNHVHMCIRKLAHTGTQTHSCKQTDKHTHKQTQTLKHSQRYLFFPPTKLFFSRGDGIEKQGGYDTVMATDVNKTWQTARQYLYLFLFTKCPLSPNNGRGEKEDSTHHKFISFSRLPLLEIHKYCL